MPSATSSTEKDSLACSKKRILSKKDLKTHVEFLTSDPLEGRLTGTMGEKLATQYVANVFHHLGLEPAGDNGTFFQAFDFMAGVSLGKSNSFTITNQKGETKHLILERDWRPLSFSDNLAFESTELVFAGYGITAPALGNHPAYDSYSGLNVKDKWVVVFRYIPEKITDEQRRHLNQYASPRYKVFTAHDHGAKGVIFVSGPNSKVNNELIPLSFDASLSGSGIVAVSVTDKTLDDLLKFEVRRPAGRRDLTLQTMQDKLDLGQQDVSSSLTDIKIMGQINIEQNKQRGRNVLAKLKLGAASAEMMVVSAHVDHLGRGELSGLIHSGADDNASGVASVLEASARLSQLKTLGKLHGKKDILFAIWSGEELGLLGSAHFVQDFMTKSTNNSLHPAIDADINLDMVGRFREKLALQGTGSSSMWPMLIEQANAKHAIPLISQSDPYLPTDSTSFYLHGVPSLNFFTGSHEEYHTPRDTADTLNYEGMKNITELLVDLILALEKQPKAIDFRQVSKTGDRHGRGFRVYLGTIPNYTSADISGVKLEGVTKDSPAEQAGIKPNDVIIKLAGKTIHDIYDYTYVLSALRIGEPVKMVVLRGQATVALTIIARHRE